MCALHSQRMAVLVAVVALFHCCGVPCVCVRVFVHVFVRALVHVCVRVCMRVCICVSVYVYDRFATGRGSCAYFSSTYRIQVQYTIGDGGPFTTVGYLYPG